MHGRSCPDKHKFCLSMFVVKMYYENFLFQVLLVESKITIWIVILLKCLVTSKSVQLVTQDYTSLTVIFIAIPF